jgi:hypothetical protein
MLDHLSAHSDNMYSTRHPHRVHHVDHVDQGDPVDQVVSVILNFSNIYRLNYIHLPIHEDYISHETVSYIFRFEMNCN